jgi:tRNA uridine 5-carboxymethylaminomethyl modification enzyme
VQSCVGGTAKGHLVREIDAFGGLMGEQSTLREYNSSSQSQPRAAVWSPRAQADKLQYGKWVRAALDAEPTFTGSSAAPDGSCSNLERSVA